MIRPLDPALGLFMATLIRGYQRYVSPYKGYTCAHRATYGADSCSEFGKKVFAEEGWQSGLRCLGARFRACHVAGRFLRMNRLHNQARDEYFDEPPGVGSKVPPGGKPVRKTSGCIEDTAAEFYCSLGIEFCCSASSYL